MSTDRVYAAIDLKSFYASVECVERGLDPLTTNLVVADVSRTEKTICLAVTPALKKYGLSGRSRLFEVVEKAREVEARSGKKLDYIVAQPRMKLYMSYSLRIYEKVYARYLSPEDIHVYSVDEVMVDLTRYLMLYGLTPRELTRKLIREIFALTGITATAGIGTNLYLAKVAMDIVAKHVEADADGVRIAELDESSYREKLWSHRPITDFWRVGRGIAARLERHGCYTMGDVARLSLTGEDTLYKDFGVDAELLIDHAWGIEPCTIADIKTYRPKNGSLTAGQVLACPYSAAQGRLIVREMADQLAMELTSRGLTAESVTLSVGYEKEDLDSGAWQGEVSKDFYGRKVPRMAHGSAPLLEMAGERLHTDSSRRIVEAASALYDRITEPSLHVRRFYLSLNNTARKTDTAGEGVQLSFLSDTEMAKRSHEAEQKEERIQQAMVRIRQKYGGNALLKGMSLEDGATGRERNAQLGGHAAGEDKETGWEHTTTSSR